MIAKRAIVTLLTLLVILSMAGAVNAAEWDYTDTSFAVSSEDAGPEGIFWDGTNFWMVGSLNDRVYKYNSTWSYTGTSFLVSSQDTTPRDILWDGSNWWVAGANTDTVYKYTSGWSYTGTSYSISSEEGSVGGIAWDGTNFWMVGASQDTVYKYNSTWSYTGTSFLVSSEDATPTGIFWDGTNFWMAGSSTDTVYKYSSTWTYQNTSYPLSEDTNPRAISGDGTNFWMAGGQTDTVYKYEGPLKCGDTITSSITLTEDLKNSTGGATCSGIGLVVGAADLVIDCAGYSMNGTSTSGNYGIDNTGGYNNITVKNCFIRDFWMGVWQDAATYGTFLNNTINTLSQPAILLTNADFTNIIDNTLFNSFYGIQVGTASTDNNITGNIIHDNTFEGIQVNSNAHSNTFANNTIYDNGRDGINIQSSLNSIIVNNMIYGNTGEGIDLNNADNSNITNNFLNNTVNVNERVTSTGNNWNTTKTLGTNIIGGPNLGGNFYSEYAGVDINSDGIGDTETPYTTGMNGGGQDLLPLTNNAANLYLAPSDPTTSTYSANGSINASLSGEQEYTTSQTHQP